MSPRGLDAWRLAGSGFEYRGHRIFYRDQGRGDTALLLIHGFPTASWDWARLWPQLTQKFPRVIAPDMIGFGFSAKPAGYDYSILDQAELHEKLLAQLGVTRVHLLAHDYGDTVAQELLARFAERHEKISLPPPAGGDTEGGTRQATATAPTQPSPAGEGGLHIESCVLLNGGLFPEVHRARLIQKLLLTPLGPLLARAMNRRGFGRTFGAIFGANTQPTPQELDEFWSLIREHNGHRQFHRLIRYMPERKANRGRWVGVLQNTKVPLRFINGPDDPISGAHMLARYRELVPSPDTVSLPGIGHYPQVEDPAGVLRAFFEFHAQLRR